MHLFDRVEEKEINSTFDVYALNEEGNQAYLLRDAIIHTSSSSIDGFRLSISCRQETYIYRGNFSTEIEMKMFADNVIRLLQSANKKNYTISRI